MKDKKEIIAFIVIVTAVFTAIALFLIFGPRSTRSELERRELAEFPTPTASSLVRGEAGPAVSDWFADTVPARDPVMNLAMDLRNMTGIRNTGEESIRLHNVQQLRTEPREEETVVQTVAQAPAASAGSGKSTAKAGAGQTGSKPAESGKAAGSSDTGSSAAAAGASSDTGSSAAAAGASSDTGSSAAAAGASSGTGSSTAEPDTPAVSDGVPTDEYTALPEEAFTVGANGIVVSGSGSNTRAIMMYGGSPTVARYYAEVVNKYPAALPGVRVYCMVIPTAVSYYCPVQALSYTGSQLDQIRNIMETLSPEVTGVDVYTALGEHTDEPIYLRTDHHWAPLGAYYAAREFARAAGVSYPDLSAYEEHVVHNYVGTMFMYSQDTAVRDNPEDFVYYIPRDLTLHTTYINYTLNGSGRVAAENPAFEGPFFQKMNDGNSNAYCVFMGGDAKITKVETGIANGRRLVILKDSYGNALPEFLFYGFEQIHILDARYFTRNIVQYVQENGITDVLFANNVFHAGTKSTAAAYERFLAQ